MRLALDIYEGQNLARKNDHRIRPRRAGAPQFAPVNSLGRRGADPSSGGGLEIILTEIGGAGGSFFTMLAGAFARMACAWRSIFTRAKTSTGKMTTASDHVVHRNLPVNSLGRNRELVALGQRASKLSSRRSGGAGGSFFAMLAGAFARMACAWRSISTRAKTSTGKMTTASDHVVHRNLPVNSLGRRIACTLECHGPRIGRIS
jgi:hypothetical protein